MSFTKKIFAVNVAVVCLWALLSVVSAALIPSPVTIAAAVLIPVGAVVTTGSFIVFTRRTRPV